MSEPAYRQPESPDLALFLCPGCGVWRTVAIARDGSYLRVIGPHAGCPRPSLALADEPFRAEWLTVRNLGEPPTATTAYANWITRRVLA